MMMNVLIFLIGLLIYAGSGLQGLCYLLGATAVTWLLGRSLRKYPWLLWLGVGLNAAALLLVKLQGVLPVQLLSVMGLSYFSLQLISYLVDVYRGSCEPEKSPLRFALYVTYLPHLYVGPIERYGSFAARLSQRQITLDGVVSGAVRALWGCVKKLVLAARLGVLVSAIAAAPEKYRGGYALLAMVLYSIQLYADFSGAMDMVLGISKMLGLTLSENFDTPYFSQTVREFWKRWHMTLGTWLQNYVYIPLGGNRKGRVRKVLNLLVTFLVSGLWHGVHYLLWGVLNGLLVATGDALKTRWKWLNRGITFVLISLLWAFFVWPDTGTALEMLASVFTCFNYAALPAGVSAMGLTAGDGIVLAAALLALWQYDWHAARWKAAFARWHPAAKTAVACALALLVLVFGRYGLGFQAEAFIYSRF